MNGIKVWRGLIRVAETLHLRLAGAKVASAPIGRPDSRGHTDTPFATRDAALPSSVVEAGDA
jgi:hypothetical protein